MKNIILSALLIFITNNLFAQSDIPTLPKIGPTSKAFIPKGWKILYSTKGDLNKDLLVDEVLIIENTNPKNFIKNDQMGSNTLNTNKRVLIVLFKKADHSYQLIAQNNVFIPSAGSEESPCLEDPLAETEGPQISNGLLKIHFQHFYSCSAWEVYNFHYTFRYQNQKFELIGYDKSSMHPSSGEMTATSINFSMGKMSVTTGDNAFKDGNKPKTIWKKIKPSKLLDLEKINEEIISTYILNL